MEECVDKVNNRGIEFVVFWVFKGICRFFKVVGWLNNELLDLFKIYI